MWSTNTRLSLIAFLGICLATAGARAQAPAAEDKLLEVLASKAAVADKANACRELRAVATEKSIPALAALLTDADLSHPARNALEAIPAPAAGAALRDAVGKAAGLAKSGIIDSIGERRDERAIPVLASALADSEPQVRAAAAAALGRIATTEAAEPLIAARYKAKGADRAIFGQALVRYADQLRAAGAGHQASAFYAELSQPNEPRAVRMAALRSMLQPGGPNTVPMLAQALGDQDALVRQAAAGHLQNLPAKAFQTVAANLDGLPPDSQVAMLAAIRIRREKSLAPVVLKAVGNTDLAVRVAAVSALGSVGDAASLPRLIELLANDDALGKAARQTLEVLDDPRVDQQLASLLHAENDPARRVAWIGLMEARRPVGATTLLVKEATHDRPEVRSRAMAALANLAGPKEIPGMAAAVLHAEKGAERDNAEKAVMIVCQQNPDADKRAEPVLGFLKTAKPADRAALLPLLGRIGGSAAKQTIQSALTASDADLNEAAVRAICNWPDASVAEQLLELSQKAPVPAHRLWALRAFIRVIALPSDLPDAKKLALLKQALQQAERNDERNLVLERAAAVRTVESLRFLVPYLNDPALAQTACKSITELGRHKELREPNRAEFVPALEKVGTISDDAGVKERARRYIQSKE